MMHVMKLMKVSLLAKFLDFLQDGLPINLKAIHILHTSTVVEFTLNIVKSMVSGNVLSKTVSNL